MDKDRITGAAKDAAGKVESTLGNIAGDASARAAGRAREVGGAVQNIYGQAKDAAQDAGDAAADFAHDAYEAGSKTYRDGSRAMARTMGDNPLGALLIAGGIGFALAMLMTRPSRRQRWR